MNSRGNAAFWAQYRALPAAVRAQARLEFRQFRENPDHSGLRFKKLNSAYPLWSVRFGDGYRVVGQREADPLRGSGSAHTRHSTRRFDWFASARKMMEAEFLLIDVGNTTVKLRLATSARLLGRSRRLPTAGLVEAGGERTLRTTLAGWQYERVVMSAVVPAAARVLAGAWPDVVNIDARLDTGVDLRGYPGRKTLGADRLANVAGALALHGPGPLIVVDFGTAATFNAVDAKGSFLGGVIAPGLAAFRDYLPARGAQLPQVRLTGATPSAIGRTTVAAIRAGTLLGYRGMVREILGGLQDELGRNARVIATGGDARFLSTRGWGLFDVVDPDLTFHGLRVIAARFVG